MKILLINPSGKAEEEYGALSKAGTELPQLGLASIVTSVQKAGFPVKVLDFHVEGLDKSSLIELIKQEKFDIIGFSVYITTLNTTLVLSELIKREIPEAKIIVGGPHVTLYPDDCYNENIDYIFLGEADEAIIEFMNTLKNGGNVSGIQGILCRKNGLFEGNNTINLIQNLDSLPLLELDKMYDLSMFYPPIHVRGNKVINVVGIRGCPYKCTFCAVAEINGKKVRKLTPVRFVDQIEYFVRRGFDSFMFYDDTFTIDKKRALEVSKEIIKRNLKIHWNCFTRVDLLTPELLNYMRESGCYHIMFGCESFNDKTLLLLKKGFTVEQCYKGIEMTTEAGIMAASSFMLGLPGETKNDMLNTIDQVSKSRFSTVLFPIFEPYKGTSIFEECKKQGRWIKSDYKNKLLLDQDEIWEPDSCSREEIEHLSLKAYRAFYLRLTYLPKLYNLIINLPLKRKARFFNAGFDYFFLSRFRKKSFIRGSRFR